MQPLIRASRNGLILLCIILLAACTSMTPDTTKRAYCNMLKSKLVFAGSTSNTRQANIQTSEEPLQQQTYNAEDCADTHW